MIDIDPNDIVVARRASGRFVIFTSTDVRPAWPLRWWGVVADTGGDGFGFLVRLDGDAALDGWTARQRLAVARRRAAAEGELHPSAATAAAVADLDLAAASLGELGGRAARDDPVTFVPASEPSPYGWTVARCDGFHLPLCPDPESLGEGVTPEQLLIVLDQLMLDATRAFPHALGIWACRRRVAAALAAEGRRAVAARSGGTPSTSTD